MSFFNKKKKREEDLELKQDIEFGNRVQNIKRKPDVLTPEEVLNIGNTTQESNNNALESLKRKLTKMEPEPPENDTPTEIKEEQNTEKSEEISAKTIIPEEKAVINDPPKTSLVDKCLPYFVDNEGKDITVNKEPLYKLQSVADILEADTKERIKRLSEKYGIEFDEISVPTTTAGEIEITEEPELPIEEPKAEKPASKENDGDTKPILVISDIDGSTGSFPKVTEPPKKVSTQTITFTPVTSGNINSEITVTTKTQQIDLTGEFTSLPEEIPNTADTSVKLQENDFDEFVPKTEVTDRKTASRLIRKFSISKRNHFIVSALTILLTLIISIAKLPFLSEAILQNTTIFMTVCTVLSGISVLLNGDMFIDLIKLFKKSSGPDCAASLASLTTICYAIFGILKGEIITDLLITLGVILSFRSISSFRKSSYMLSNLKLINTATPKKAVKLIDDPAVTFSMAKDSVEGDTLIAAAQKTENVNDYMKYSTFGEFMQGKMPYINGLSIILSVITAVATALYFDALVYGLYAAAAIQCFGALPTLFLIDTLPIYSAAKRLNSMGAMISGKMGAEQIEKSNATVLSSTDLFPEGTVTLHQMKVLTENSLDDTLIRAASLTEYMSSPLAPIFKAIVKSGNISSLPDTDTVKYEDRLGISGWVDNRLLFIGNRTLMETHGIEVPSVEIDRKILRQGYFPVYVATREKACALLIIKYSVNPKVAKELRRLTGLGITLLVNNTDPNLTEEMICDYLGLYDDSVKVMSAAGCHIYKNVSASSKTASAPAAYKNNNICLAAILNCATRIKRSNMLLTVCFIIFAVLGAIIFAYTSFGGSASLINGSVLLIYNLICTALSYLIYLIEKP